MQRWHDSRPHAAFRGILRLPEVTWRIQRQHDQFRGDTIHYHTMHSYVNYENVVRHRVYIHLLGDGKHCVWKCCAAPGSQYLHLYMQIRVFLSDEKHCRWSEGSTVKGATGVCWALPGVTSAGVTGWKLPKTRWWSITVWGCGLLCALMRLHYVWQRVTTKKHRRHLASEAQYKQGTQLGASKEQDMVRAESTT